jgi:hypothetical protein
VNKDPCGSRSAFGCSALDFFEKIENTDLVIAANFKLKKHLLKVDFHFFGY